MTEASLILRNAIALNNMGISLIERHCYGQALETLTDAFSLLKVSAGVQDTTRSSPLTRCSKESAGKHHLALQRLAQPQPCKRRAVMIEVLTSKSSQNPTRSVVEDSSSPKICSIRIDDVDFSDRSIDRFYFAFECATLLHNLGLAHICMSYATGRPNTKLVMAKSSAMSCAIKYNTRAIRLFRLSHSLYAKALSENSSSVQDPELLHVMAVILSSLIHALKSSCQHEEAQAFCFMLANIKSTFHEIAQTNSLLFGGESSTAAAA
jgi:hypothetical protein